MGSFTILYRKNLGQNNRLYLVWCVYTCLGCIHTPATRIDEFRYTFSSSLLFPLCCIQVFILLMALSWGLAGVLQFSSLFLSLLTNNCCSAVCGSFDTWNMTFSAYRDCRSFFLGGKKNYHIVLFSALRQCWRKICAFSRVKTVKYSHVHFFSLLIFY